VNTIRSFLREEVGFLLSTETVLLGTILVIGMIVGLAEVRNAVTEELGDFSQAIAWLSQDFSYTSVSSSNAPTDIASSGSVFDDTDDLQYMSSVSANGILVDAVSVADDE
jgi:hypothetical protein